MNVFKQSLFSILKFYTKKEAMSGIYTSTVLFEIINSLILIYSGLLENSWHSSENDGLSLALYAQHLSIT